MPTNTTTFGLAKPTVGSDNNSWGDNGWTSPADTAIGMNDNMQLIDYHLFSRKDGGSIEGPVDINGAGTFTGSGDVVTLATDETTYTFGTTTNQPNDVLTRSEIEALVNALRIPVNGLYMSSSSTNPASTLGYGTWVSYAAGRALVGVGSASGLTWAGGDLKGDDRRTLSTSNMPSHNHSCTSGGSHSHAVDPPNTTTSTHGGHSHSNGSYASDSKTVSGSFTICRTQDQNSTNYSVIRTTTGGFSRTTNTGSGFNPFDMSFGEPYNNTDTVIFSQSHSHDVTGTSSSGGSHSHSVNIGSFTSGSAGSHSHTIGNNGSGTSFEIVQPSIAVYVWRRTA